MGIFWKASRLEAVELMIHPYPGCVVASRVVTVKTDSFGGGGKGVVQVKLKDGLGLGHLGFLLVCLAGKGGLM